MLILRWKHILEATYYGITQSSIYHIMVSMLETNSIHTTLAHLTMRVGIQVFKLPR